MTRCAGLIALAALCAAGCGGTPEPQQTSPMSRPGPNAVAPVSPADRLRVGSATWSPQPAPEAATAAAAAPAEAPAAAEPAPKVSEPAPAPAAEAPAQPAPVAAPATPSLFDRLGGAAAVAIVVDTFTARVHGDPNLEPLFHGVDMDNFKRLMRELICEGTGGGCSYTGRSMLAAHQGLNVREDQFNVVVGYLSTTLDQFNVPAQEKNELLTILGGMKGDIVGH
jgi:hemoglobin